MSNQPTDGDRPAPQTLDRPAPLPGDHPGNELFRKIQALAAKGIEAGEARWRQHLRSHGPARARRPTQDDIELRSRLIAEEVAKRQPQALWLGRKLQRLGRGLR